MGDPANRRDKLCRLSKNIPQTDGTGVLLFILLRCAGANWRTTTKTVFFAIKGLGGDDRIKPAKKIPCPTIDSINRSLEVLLHMPLFTDQCGFTISLPHPPQRIVSIVPSQTELLYTLGAEVTGITRFCVHPNTWFQTKPRVGGTKQLHLDRILELQPDLVIANREENLREQVEAIRNIAPVWTSDVHNLPTALEMIRQVGLLTNKPSAAETLINSITIRFSEMKRPAKPLRVAYLIWREPYMSVGGDTFIHALLHEAGMENVFGNKTRYPTVTTDELRQANPDCILLSSEPYPFSEKHIQTLRDAGVNSPAYLVDGELFSWYGSRLLHSPAYFESLNEKIRTTQP